MSYHLTVLRSSNGEQRPISLEEAISVAKRIEGWSFIEEPPTFEYRCVDGTFALWYQNGELWTKNPDEYVVDAMIVFARQLEARVRGDEWETYDNDRTYLHPDDVGLKKEAEKTAKALLSRSLNQQRLIRYWIIGFFIVLGAAGFAIGRLFENN